MDLGFEHYRERAMFMRSYKGKIIVRINDYPDIRGCFVGLHMEGLDIKFAYELGANGGLFVCVAKKCCS